MRNRRGVEVGFGVRRTRWQSRGRCIELQLVLMKSMSFLLVSVTPVLL